MSEVISPEKRRAIEKSQKEQQLMRLVDISGLSMKRKEAIKKKLAKASKDGFNWGSVHIFLQRMETMISDIKETAEREK